MRDTNNYLFKELQKVSTQPIFGDVRIGDLFLLVLLCMLVLLLEQLIRRRIVVQILKRTQMDPALQFAVGRIAGYLFILVGFWFALQAVGVPLHSFAFFAGVFAFGIGFGLQNIISNFISGIIILAERPISVGDRIEVSGVAGQVKHISLRSTTVVTNDNISIIVPNADFITQTVTNWSHGDDKVRIRLPVLVSYQTDVEKLKKILLEVAAENPAALKSPAPNVFFDSYTDAGYKFELAVWTEEMTFSPRRFRSDLNYAVLKKLRENNIAFPVPSQVVYFQQRSEKEQGLLGPDSKT